MSENTDIGIAVATPAAVDLARAADMMAEFQLIQDHALFGRSFYFKIAGGGRRRVPPWEVVVGTDGTCYWAGQRAGTLHEFKPETDMTAQTTTTTVPDTHRLKERAGTFLDANMTWRRSPATTQQAFLDELAKINGHHMNQEQTITAWLWFELGARVTISFRAGVSAALGIVRAGGVEALARAVERRTK